MRSSVALYALDRRDFLKGTAAATGGLLLGLNVPALRAGDAPASAGALNAFVHVGTDGRVTLLIHKAEMGQGVYSSLAQLIAEELECEWGAIHVVGAPVDPAYNHPGLPVQFTGGSSSVASSWEPLRRAGATARELLVAAAAEKFGVPVSECHAAQGRVLHEASGRALTYGELTVRASQLEPPAEVALKPPAQFKLIGRSLPRLDSAGKADGSAVFSLDVRRPGQVFAVVAHAPFFGARIASFDAGKARAMAGVIDVFEIPTGVAIVARDTAAAIAARQALKIDWRGGARSELDTEALRERYRRLAGTPGLVVRTEGDAARVLADDPARLTAEYELPFLAHAPMEPLNAVVELVEGRCDIWAGTQFQSEDRKAAARTAALPEEQVHIHTTYMGGGFGRRANPASDYLVEAVEVAKRSKAPVLLLWTREDDIRGGWYRPQCCHRVSASVDAEGRAAAWHQVIVGQSVIKGTNFEAFVIKDGIDATSVEGAADMPYSIPDVRVELHTTELPVPVQWWRSVGHTHTAFVVETMIDELAARAGRDPVAYRSTLLKDHPRHLAALDLAARKADWGRPLPAGRARGVAVHESFGSVVAEIAEVSLDAGQPRVHRVVCAVHCGRAVNPGQVAAQIESGVIYGLSAALMSEITIREGRVVQGNFDAYRVARISDAPQIEVHIVPSDDAPTGVGEPGTPPVAPAVANALAALTGVRARRLPLTHVSFSAPAASA